MLAMWARKSLIIRRACFDKLNLLLHGYELGLRAAFIDRMLRLGLVFLA